MREQNTAAYSFARTSSARCWMRCLFFNSPALHSLKLPIAQALQDALTA